MSVAPSEYSGIVTCDDWLCATCGRERRAHLGPEMQEFHREEIEFAGMLRVHNEARWIREVLESIRPLCELTFVLDDHSTDDTVAICEAVPGVTVFRSPFHGLNESRDKNWLYDEIIRRCAPQWILCVDGDEVLEYRGPQIIREHCASAAVNAFALKIEFLWNAPTTVRTDRIYGDFWRPSLFRPQHEVPGSEDTRTLLTEFRFMSTPFGRHVNSDKPNLHCSSVPQRLLHGFKYLPARLKHYGYMERSSRVRKLDYYTSIDWLNSAEDCYRHMCQGDNPSVTELPKIQAMLDRRVLSLQDVRYITEVPPEAKLVHAGPIQLSPWNDGPWEVSQWARQRL